MLHSVSRAGFLGQQNEVENDLICSLGLQGAVTRVAWLRGGGGGSSGGGGGGGGGEGSKEMEHVGDHNVRFISLLEVEK